MDIYIPHDGSYHGICVCHRCDNPACVRVDHLFLGTHKENGLDMDAKKRSATQVCPERAQRGEEHHFRRHPEKLPRGEARGSAKLNTEKVINMRARYAAGGVCYYQLAEEFGVSRSTVTRIIKREKWKHVPDLDWV